MDETKEEVCIPIAQWDAMSIEGRSEYLRSNRLYLQRYSLDEKDVKTHIVLRKHDDNVVVK